MVHYDTIIRYKVKFVKGFYILINLQSSNFALIIKPTKPLI